MYIATIKTHPTEDKRKLYTTDSGTVIQSSNKLSFYAELKKKYGKDNVKIYKEMKFYETVSEVNS